MIKAVAPTLAARTATLVKHQSTKAAAPTLASVAPTLAWTAPTMEARTAALVKHLDVTPILRRTESGVYVGQSKDL
jgi:hypothetical protein